MAERPLEIKISLAALEHLGMNLYSTIPAGFQRRKAMGARTAKGRQPMGRKGIGKLSSFRQVFFPMAGQNDGWAKIARNLKAEIDESLISAYRGTVSLPFEAGEHRRAAVKIVDDRGIESLKIVELG